MFAVARGQTALHSAGETRNEAGRMGIMILQSMSSVISSSIKRPPNTPNVKMNTTTWRKRATLLEIVSWTGGPALCTSGGKTGSLRTAFLRNYEQQLSDSQ